MTKTQGNEHELVVELLNLLKVEKLERDLYLGQRKPGAKGRIFGGQVVAQSLQAAQRTVDTSKAAHSLHAYFMRPGDDDLPIHLQVVRDFDGLSFATRRVTASQRGEPILTLTCSFHSGARGIAHYQPMPTVALPDALPNVDELDPSVAESIHRARLDWMLRPSPIELKATDERLWSSRGVLAPQQSWWVRVRSALGDDLRVHRAALAYISDFQLLATALLPLEQPWQRAGLKIASVDHALWFHEPFRADEWLLYSMDSPWAGHGRGLNHGRFYNLEGRLVASVAQEGLMRMSDVPV